MQELPSFGPHRDRFEREGRREFSEGLVERGWVVLDRSPEWENYSAIFVDEGGHAIDRKEVEVRRQWALARGIPFFTFSAHSLFEALPVPHRDFLRTFTDFRKALNRVPLLPQEAPSGSSRGPSEPRRDPGADPRSAFPFCGGESDALAHLKNYLARPERIHAYKTTRNRMLGVEYSSKFSPFLASGVLSVRQIWFELERFERNHGSSEGLEWLRFELLWREYFRWLERDAGESFYSIEGFRKVSPPPAVEDRERFERWTRAESGEPFIDANLRELNLTGYMSNRGRQNVASHFIHQLGLPWKWGADYFYKMLMDADLSQNYGNWSYLAGVGADPRSFGGQARRFDLSRQMREYDPEGEYQRTWT